MTVVQPNSIDHFPRPILASRFKDALLGKDTLSDATNGLFLSAPRREGKSVFLQQDLMPALIDAGVEVVYVDLWTNKDKDPALVIAEAIGQRLKERAGFVARSAMKVGLDSITVAGALKMDTKNIGKPEGATLHDALRALIIRTKKPVALIIDEAQHAIGSANGMTAMAALKAARDTINNSGGDKLMLVMSGSDRDKLIRLVSSKQAPFYGSIVRTMPHLDDAYILYLVDKLKQFGGQSNLSLDSAKISQAFTMFGFKPQFLREALGRALSPFDNPGKIPADDYALAAASQHVLNEQTAMLNTYLGLRDLEQLVVWRLLEMRGKFVPYDADALAFYSQQMDKSVTSSMVQAAILSLRNREPCIIWQSNRSEYALEDAQMGEWYEQLKASGGWPPGVTPAVPAKKKASTPRKGKGNK